MSEIEHRLERLGFALPAPMKLPPGVTLSFPFVRLHGDRALVSGHGPLAPDGSLAAPLGKVGGEVTLDQARHAARLTGLAILSSLKAALGDLDRIGCWLRAFGMVNAEPDFNQYPAVINGFSDLIVAALSRKRNKSHRL